MTRCLRVVGAFALVVVSGAEARAQMGVARGQVVDEKGAPVADATVDLVFRGEVERQYKTRTNKKGEYTQVVPTGNYRVTVSKDGYQGTYLDHRVATGDPTDLPTLKITSRATVAREAMAPILAQFEKGAALSKAGKVDEAIAVYRDVESKHPDMPEVHFNLGTLYARQEKWPEAEAAFGKAVELAPDNTQAHVLLADVHSSMGRTDEAVAALERLVAKSPDDPKLRFELGLLYQKARRGEEALAAFEEARKRDPGNVEVLYLLGTLSINQGRIEQARGYLQSYLDRAPADGAHRATASELLLKLQPATPPRP
jgi:cytochrome c-type biogenesis protein CcmH/NrfG